jgi:hypothetical protein
MGVMPPPWPEIAKDDMCIINNDDEFLFIPHKNKCKQPNVTKFSICRNNFYVQFVPKKKAKAPTQNITSTPIFGSGNLVQINLLHFHIKI